MKKKQLAPILNPTVDSERESNFIGATVFAHVTIGHRVIGIGAVECGNGRPHSEDDALNLSLTILTRGDARKRPIQIQSQSRNSAATWSWTRR